MTNNISRNNVEIFFFTTGEIINNKYKKSYCISENVLFGRSVLNSVILEFHLSIDAKQ